MSSGAEKRQHHRFMARLEARVVSGDRVAAGLKLATVDIGVGGARCVSSVRLEAGTILHLTLTLTGADLEQPADIALDAQVLRCVDRPAPHHGYPHEVALQFVRLDARERRRLQTYLNNL